MKSICIASLIHWFIGSRIHWLTHWFFDSLNHHPCFIGSMTVDSLIHWFIDSLTHWFIDSLIHWSIDYFIDSLVHWFIVVHWFRFMGPFIQWFGVHAFIDSIIRRFMRSLVPWVSCAWLLSGHFIGNSLNLLHHLIIRWCAWQLNTSLLLHLNNFPIGHWILKGGSTCSKFPPRCGPGTIWW